MTSDSPNHSSPSGDLDLFAQKGGLRLATWFAGAYVLGGLLLIGVSLATSGRTPLSIPPMFLLVGAAVLFMIRSGRLRQGVMTIMWAMAALATYVGFGFSGLRAPVMIVLPLICMASGWLLGTRQALLISTTTVVLLLVLFRMHLDGHPFTEPVLPNYLLVLTFTVVLGTTLGILSIASFRKQYQHAMSLSVALEQRVEELRRSEETLEARVEERTLELGSALAQLKQTQQELVKAETLASLGSMVAGVSHELNTPIGNALTVASTLSHRFSNFSEQVDSDAIKRSSLKDFAAQGQEMAALIERSVHRAAELIASFKQVAVDQISERRRSFELRDLVNDVVATLRPGFKNQTWRVEIDVPEGLTCDSFPGPLGHVLSNLVQNAAIHGFDGRSDGCIAITAVGLGSEVEIAVADDGVGMDERTLAHVFDPFFTTRLGKGGSGLGLSICHRLSTSVLGGTLRVTSVKGQGSSFILRLPREVPGRL